VTKFAALLIAISTFTASSAAAATVPTGFTDTPLASGLSSPTAMQFAPDGRLFVCEQGGKLRVIKNDVLLPTPFITLTVSALGERGLLGVAFDPNFAANHFVYVYYTATTPTIHNRISRLTANGDVAVAGSELAILDLPTLGATNHNGGALAFGPDGKLYVAVGENAVSSNAQSMSTPLGKMLRINSNGSFPTDNPFFNTTTGINRAIWALGLRNPFTFAFNPGGAEMFINDVGERTWEEIDDGIAGANYGWPTTEGATTNPNFTSPRHTYNHTDGCAISGGAFYSPLTQQFPTQYFRDYFFADYCGGWIRKLDPAAGNSVVGFASGIASPVDLKVSEDGSLYYLARGSGSTTGVVSRIRWTSAGGVTADSVTPASGSGASQTFALKYSDTAGATNITTALAWFAPNAPNSAASSCMVIYNRPTNIVALLNDAGTSWTSAAVGSSGVLQNSQCAITLGSSTTVSTSGAVLTVNLAVTFKPAYAGAKTIFMGVENANGMNSGLQTRGTWSATAGGTILTADSVTPASGAGTSQLFAAKYSDTAGASGIGAAFVWFLSTSSSSAVNSCLAYYNRAANTLALLNDAGTAWTTAAIGSAGTLQNSQCTLTLGASSTAVTSGNLLTLNLAMSFKPAFAGAKNVLLYAANVAGMNSGWQARGTWTVP
jgi:glucose/arabinose dehydrogenase